MTPGPKMLPCIGRLSGASGGGAGDRGREVSPIPIGGNEAPNPINGVEPPICGLGDLGRFISKPPPGKTGKASTVSEVDKIPGGLGDLGRGEGIELSG